MIELRCFRDPWTEDMLESEINMPDSRYILLMADGKTVGYYAYMHIIDEVHILNVAVLPEYQGRGLGSRMMAHLMSTLPEGTVGATLEVRASNERARHLYEKCGFVAAGVRPHYYMDGEDAVIYWLTEGV
jgi:ribosomal-protein-alanine N-acetyltransferase